jgi:hypothetical protein
MPEEAVIVATPVQEPAQDTPVIEPRRMSYEDLNKSLGDAPASEPEPAVEPEKKEDVKVEPESKEPEPVKQATPGDNPPETSYENVIKELDEAKKRIEAQDKFNMRLGTEIGLLRKTTPEQELQWISTVKETYDKIYYEQGPFAAKQFHDQAITERRQIDQQQTTLRNIESIKGTREKVLAAIPSFESSIDDLVPVLKDEGFNENFIGAFKQNPYVVDNGELRLLFKAASYRKENVAVKAENEALKAKISELEKQPDQLIQNIQNATKTVNGKSSGTGNPAPGKVDLSNVNPRRLPYDQLVAIEKSFTT